MLFGLVISTLAWCSVQIFIDKLFGSKWEILTYGLFGCSVPRIIEYHFYQNPHLLTFLECGKEGLTDFERTFLIFCTGYFAFDIFLGIRLRDPWHMQLHHFIAFSVVITPLYYECCVFEILVCLWIGEFSAPCAFWIFRYEKEPEIYNSKPMLVVKIIYFILFVILRFGVGSYALWRFFNSTETLLIIKLGCLLMTAFNCVVFKQSIDEIKGYFVKKKDH